MLCIMWTDICVHERIHPVHMANEFKVATTTIEHYQVSKKLVYGIFVSIGDRRGEHQQVANGIAGALLRFQTHMNILPVFRVSGVARSAITN